MKHKLCYSAVLVGSLLLQGCGGGGLIGGPQDKNDMQPVAEVVTTYKLRPSAATATITTKDGEILDAAGKPVQLRGINMKFTQAATVSSIAGIKAIKDTGSNTVHLYINENTTDPDLEIALSKVIEQGMLAIITLTDGPSVKVVGQNDTDALTAAVKNLWLDKWLSVIAQDRFQPHIMINIADSWGPKGTYDPNNGYFSFIKGYKIAIDLFREAGFKVPLIIDAPFGDDYYAFSNERGQQLLAIDSAKNLIVGIKATGTRWDSLSKMTNGFTNLMDSRLPYVVDSFGGSGVEGDALDHLSLMQKAVGDSALGLNVPWIATNDSAAYVIPFKAPMALIDGVNIITKLYLTSSYLERKATPTSDGKLVPQGKLTFAMYVRDVNGNTLRVGSVEANTLNDYQWNRISFTMPKTLADVDVANYLNGTTTIDFTKIKEIGVQLLANGKAAAVKGAIKLDDLEIYPGSPPATLAVESTFNNSAAPGWEKPGWSPGKVVFEDGYAKLSLGAGDWGLVMETPGYKYQDVLPKIDFKQTVFVDMKVFVPTSYAGQTPSFTVKGNFTDPKGAPYNWDIAPETGAAVLGELKYGDWNTFRATLKWGESNDVSSPQDLTIQLGGVGANTDPLLLDTITITQQQGQKMKTVSSSQYKATFSESTEGFVNAGWDDGKATLKIEDGALLVTVPEGDKGAINKGNVNAVPEIDLKGNTTIKMKIFIPADWAGKDFAIKPFMQNWSSAVAHFEYAGKELKVADLVPGGWVSLEFKPVFPSTFTRGSLNMFGFQFVSVPAGTIKFDDIEIVGDTQVPDSQPIYTMGFDTDEEYSVVKFDFAGGSLSESALVSAKTKAWKIAPFSWTASSWVGNTGANAALNISKAEDLVDLTARGEEIVNGVFGIKATSTMATFPPAPVKP